MRKKKKKHNKTVLLARSKLNSVENIMSKTLTNFEISHEDFTSIMNEERNFRKQKESIRMMKSQRSDIEINKLIKYK